MDMAKCVFRMAYEPFEKTLLDPIEPRLAPPNPLLPRCEFMSTSAMRRRRYRQTSPACSEISAAHRSASAGFCRTSPNARSPGCWSVLTWVGTANCALIAEIRSSLSTLYMGHNKRRLRTRSYSSRTSLAPYLRSRRRTVK
jgi:hypothetical protein